MSSRYVNFGLWYDFRNPPPSALSFTDLYRACLEQIVWAEQLGFDSVWLTEHHFCEDGYTPSPLVIAAAIGERTKRMRIGTNLMLLPLADPVRLAEDAATLSILTGGRFDLGVGLGYRQLEFDYFGRKLSHRPSLMEEGVAIIRQAWSGEPVSIQGKRFQIDGLSVAPAPEQPPKLYLGGMAPPPPSSAPPAWAMASFPPATSATIYMYKPWSTKANPASRAPSAPGTGPSSRQTRKPKRPVSASMCSTKPTSTSPGALSARRSKPLCSPTAQPPSPADCTNCATQPRP